MLRKEKQQKYIGKEPTNYVNRKIEKEEQAPLEEQNTHTQKLSQKRKMLVEKLEENTKAIKRRKNKKNDIF